MSPTQAAALRRMMDFGCEMYWWQAVRGVKGARFATVRALWRAGLVMKHPGYVTLEFQMAPLMPTYEARRALEGEEGKRAEAPGSSPLQPGGDGHRAHGACG